MLVMTILGQICGASNQKQNKTCEYPVYIKILEGKHC